MRSTLVVRALAALALVVATTFAGTPVLAGPEQDKAQARQLGIDGVKAFEAGDWSAAVKRFEAAEKLFHAPTHLLYIARGEAKLGRLIAARETYLRLEKEQLPADASPAFKKAQVDAGEERTQLETRIPTLSVRIEPPDLEGVEVMLDGRALEGSELGAAFVDPGSHRVEAKAPGREAPPVEIEVALGEKREIVLDFSGSAVAPPPPPGAGAEPAESAPEGGPGTMTILGFTGLGLGVAGIGVGTVLGIVSLGKSSEADDLYEQCGGDGGCAQGSTQGAEVRGLDEDAASFGTLALVGLGVGGALAATGVVLLVVGDDGPTEKPSDARLHVAPLPGGVMLGGRF